MTTTSECWAVSGTEATPSSGASPGADGDREPDEPQPASADASPARPGPATERRPAAAATWRMPAPNWRLSRVFIVAPRGCSTVGASARSGQTPARSGQRHHSPAGSALGAGAPVLARGHPGPALERAVEGAGVGEAQRRRGLLDRVRRVAE